MGKKLKHISSKEIKDKARGIVGSFMEKEKLSIAELTETLNKRYGRSCLKGALYNKFSRCSFKLTDFIEILDAYGYEICFKKADGTNAFDKTP